MCPQSPVSVWAKTPNIQPEGALDLQLHQDGLPENAPFRQTVINLTKDIWESHRWPEIMTLVFWPETRHHWSCLPARLQHGAFVCYSNSLFFFFSCPWSSSVKNTSIRTVRKETTTTSRLCRSYFLENKFHLARIMGVKQ